ncbi:DEAD/DEAH box helicase [Paenibacillus sp. HN-1]|nr:DEAD/DEAH box helicase [Paenibacillus sp. CGMCC 1.18879]MBY9086330.1 DEAD/DEAH box helicase [Paenibacillus sinensis]
MLQGPCLVRSDRTVLLECGHPNAEAARELLLQIAELVKTPPMYHTYRITPLTLWNAASLGMDAGTAVNRLEDLCGGSMPAGMSRWMKETMLKFGTLTLQAAVGDGRLVLTAGTTALLDKLEAEEITSTCGFTRSGSLEMTGPAEERGRLKQGLAAAGYPVRDQAGCQEGQPLDVRWRGEDVSFRLRDYQREAAEALSASGESGVIVLPCGSGKTVVGIAVMEGLKCETLILTSNTTSVMQWTEELRSRTTLASEDIGEYTGERRSVRPVTVATYQMLTHRSTKEGGFQHMKLFKERNWGLIVYDEVHLLPAPVFRATAGIQATRRVGLTATLVREDGREEDVFSLIGPKRYDCAWRMLEEEGWIAKVRCFEVAVPLQRKLRETYLYTGIREKFRLASTNPVKTEAVAAILKRHSGAPVLIIGQYLDQLEVLADAVSAPLLTGRTPQKERMKLYQEFNEGKIRVLVLSKVANFAVNLPDASVLIEVSGAFGSRQEEAQRLGRILRPKSGDNTAFFYTVVTDDSREKEFALRRRLFLLEQGYAYSEIRYETGGLMNPFPVEDEGFDEDKDGDFNVDGVMIQREAMERNETL